MHLITQTGQNDYQAVRPTRRRWAGTAAARGAVVLLLVGVAGTACGTPDPAGRRAAGRDAPTIPAGAGILVAPDPATTPGKPAAGPENNGDTARRAREASEPPDAPEGAEDGGVEGGIEDGGESPENTENTENAEGTEGAEDAEDAGSPEGSDGGSRETGGSHDADSPDGADESGTGGAGERDPGSRAAVAGPAPAGAAHV
ncbi:hypothetical protein ACSNOD_22305, partial [Streptomyces sp. URMC 123]